MSNSVDPDETAHYKPSHLDLRCLQKPIIIAYGSERVEINAKKAIIFVQTFSLFPKLHSPFFSGVPFRL